MTFINSIIEGLNKVSGFFYQIFLEVNSWPWPFWYVSGFFYSLHVAFAGLAWAFYYLNGWVDYLAGKVAAILTFGDIWSYFKWWFDAAVAAWNWVASAYRNVWNIVEWWWSSAKYIVLSWVDEAKRWATSLFNQVNAWLARLQEAWDAFKAKLPAIEEILSWFKNWPGKVLATIISWGALPGKEIENLILSKLKEWFPFYDNLVAIKDSMFDFFTNPLEFLFNRFSDWFLGPKE